MYEDEYYTYEYQSFLCPHLFPFDGRPNKRTKTPPVTHIMSLEHLSCKTIYDIDSVHIAAFSEKYLSIFLMYEYTIHGGRSSAIENILKAWPSQTFRLENVARIMFIEILNGSYTGSQNTVIKWSSHLFILIMAFVKLIFEDSECQLVTLDIQDLPFICSYTLTNIFYSIASYECQLSEEARSTKKKKKCKICTNLYIVGMDELSYLSRCLNTKGIIKFEFKCVIFDFGDISACDVDFEKLDYFNEMCNVLNTDALKYFETSLFVAANVYFKKLVMSVPNSTFLKRLTSFSLQKYFSKYELITDFNENIAPHLVNVDSLSLGYCSLATRVCTVLYKFQNLRTLRLIKVGLVEYDLKKMEESDYLRQIEHFDISFNVLCQPGLVKALINLLQTWQSNLKTLEARKIQWNPKHFHLLSEKPVEFEKLERINIAVNKISIEFLEYLMNVETLKLIIISDPNMRRIIPELKSRGECSYFRNGGHLTEFDISLFNRF